MNFLIVKTYSIFIYFLLPFQGIGLIYIFLAPETGSPKLSSIASQGCFLSGILPFMAGLKSPVLSNSGSQCTAVIYELLATVLANG